MDRDVVARLVYSMIQFLRSELEISNSSSLAEEGAESVEVALQCLETAYGISQDSVNLSVSRSLYNIFHEATKDEIKATHASNLGAEPTPEDKIEAERLKTEGNQLLKDDKFEKALECYTKAIAKDRTNPVFYCNRAAAHNKLSQHLEAIEDCKRTLRLEPQYARAYGRMGLAYSSMDKETEAIECYQKALELEPDNESYKNNLKISQEKLHAQRNQHATNSGNPFAALGGARGLNLGALGNLPGFSSGGSGAPDIQSLFNNPALMNMATQVMADPNMQNMMASFLGNVTGGASPMAPPTQSSTTPTEGSEGSPRTQQAPVGGMEALLTAGRQLAEQMQARHPDLVEQLRSQMNQPSNGQFHGGNGDNQDPPEPPQT